MPEGRTFAIYVSGERPDIIEAFANLPDKGEWFVGAVEKLIINKSPDILKAHRANHVRAIEEIDKDLAVIEKSDKQKSMVALRREALTIEEANRKFLSDIDMAKGLVLEGDIKNAHRYLNHYVKIGRLPGEEADKILSGAYNDIVKVERDKKSMEK